ncbi:hypothetical protein E1B28_006490 [Marasmius oreades]|uniref:Uncharacterized protein n=1 Tax=Marasmius oreades TaxID=181124 RepID=A0A9P7S5I7_9AGAR|nr:uncharacterized protein E1B28_006490 [Marasmius oreades]KAG7095789.1 hypothetical protein E1B28_006490 [Marasmius oreades]
MKNISNKYLTKNKRMDMTSPDQLDEDDWISAITTPSKPRVRRALESNDTSIIFLARDRALRDLVNSRLLEESVKADLSLDEDDSSEFDHHLGDQTLESPFPRTPPRRSGYPLESFALRDSPFSSSRYPYSSPTVTLALIRNDIPSIHTPTSVNSWLNEPFGTNGHHDVENTKRKAGRRETTGCLFGLRLASTGSSYSISSTDPLVEVEEETGEDGESNTKSASRLDSSSSVGSCPGASTPTPTLV